MVWCDDYGWEETFTFADMMRRSNQTANLLLSLGIKKGDKIQVFTAVGSIEVKANPTARVLPGMVHMYHGYREADVNSLMDRDNLDPYCGFPGFRSTRCGVRKGEN